jgi:hypothetical protein
MWMPREGSFGTGFRVATSLVPGKVMVDPVQVGKTLDLWRVNLAATSAAPDSIRHRLNASMVEWLEQCVRTCQAGLAPRPRNDATE